MLRASFFIPMDALNPAEKAKVNQSLRYISAAIEFDGGGDLQQAVNNYFTGLGIFYEVLRTKGNDPKYSFLYAKFNEYNSRYSALKKQLDAQKKETVQATIREDELRKRLAALKKDDSDDFDKRFRDLKGIKEGDPGDPNRKQKSLDELIFEEQSRTEEDQVNEILGVALDKVSLEGKYGDVLDEEPSDDEEEKKKKKRRRKKRKGHNKGGSKKKSSRRRSDDSDYSDDDDSDDSDDDDSDESDYSSSETDSDEDSEDDLDRREREYIKRREKEEREMKRAAYRKFK